MEKLLSVIVNNMTLDEKIGQMLFVIPEKLSGRKPFIKIKNRYLRHLLYRLYPTVKAFNNRQLRCLNKIPVGGIIFFERHLESREQIKKYIADLQANSKLPLFIGSDEEGGTVRRISRVPAFGATKFPSMCEVGERCDLKEAYNIGETLGKEMSELGFNINFAPIADIHVRDDNSLTVKRSFGSDCKVVSQMVSEVVKGLQDNNVSATLKHFPGHGSTKGDSHFELAVSDIDIDTLRQRDLVPFKAGIAAGADFVMLGHISFPNILDNNIPCVMSKLFITDILKNELNYENIVISDSLEMSALDSFRNTLLVDAINAGMDMIVMPINLKRTFKIIKKAIRQNKISMERIDDAVSRIIKIKIKKGLISI